MFHLIEQLSCVHILGCYVNSVLEKLMRGKNVVLEAHLCQSAAPVHKINCVFTFSKPGLCPGWREAEKNFVLLFSVHAMRLEQQKQYNKITVTLAIVLLGLNTALCEILRILWCLISSCHGQIERGIERRVLCVG